MLTRIVFGDESRLDTLSREIILVNEVTKSGNINRIIESVTYGDTILLVEGEPQALILNSKSFQLRNITEPASEQILSGPREGFNESILVNLSQIHRRIRSNDLKIKYYTFGRRTNTKACICYIDSLVNKEILDELYRRLDKIDIDGVLDSNYIVEIIKDAKWSPFRTVGMTERPDNVVGNLLEGKVALLVDGSPVAITVPFLFIENFQSNEDYYMNYIYTSFERMLRLVGFFIAIVTPAFYIAVVAFHHEMLPTQLFFTIQAERRNVPFPAALEAFLLLIVFDVVKEAGIRMPLNMGQALSIVGALVIGQAAVDAKLVAAPMIIVVALTAITSLLVPKLNAAAIILRYLLIIFAASFGFFGLIFGLSLIFVHLLSISSFGVPYMTPVDRLSTQAQELKDIIVRVPWCKMKQRPSIAADKTRSKKKARR